MNNLGEILQEARKAKGLSLRDASDATKIRSDFLASMEQGDFGFDLPEIYKRGFLRLYADYLDLDETQIMADYNALVSVGKNDRDSARHSHAKSQFLSRLAADAEEAGTSRAEQEVPNSDFSNAPANPLEGGSDKLPNNYLKIGGVIAAVLLLVVIIVFSISALTSDPEPAAGQGAAPEFTIKITALKDTFYTLYPASDEAKVLHSGEALANTSAEFKTREPLMLHPKDRREIKVERNGVPVDITSVPLSVKYRLRAPETQR